MSPILELLRQSIYPNKTPQPVEEKLAHFLSYEDKIQAQFGLKFVNGMEDAWNELYAAELDCAYEQGFLTAFRLWMEVSSMGAFTPAPQTAPR